MASSGPTLLPTGSHRSDLEAGPPRTSSWDRVPLTPTAAGFGIANDGVPPERNTQRRRVACLVVLAVVVVAMVGAVIFAAADYRSSSRSGSSTSGSTTDSGSGSGYPVSFFVIGDWGRRGGDNQSDVAALMGRVAEQAQRAPQFVVSTGDNFYGHGLSSPEDPLFDESFSRVYNASGLQVPWHAVLGNHDYCDSAPKNAVSSPLHQLNLSLTNRDARWHCERSYSELFAGGSLQIFFLDTSPFIQRYLKDAWAHCEGGILQQSWQAQLLELERRMNTSTAAWKLVVGHHPSYSSGDHGNNAEVIQYLEPLFRRYGVQAYFAGHDHHLEHLQLQGYHMLISGAGSKTQRPVGNMTDASRYYYQYSGFVSVSVEPEVMTVWFHTLEGGEAPTYTATIPRLGSNAKR